MAGNLRLRQRAVGGARIAPPAGGLPVNTVAPLLGGAAEVGQSQTIVHGTYTNGPILSYEYRWYVDDVLDGAATSQSRLSTAPDEGAMIRGEERAQNATGWSDWATTQEVGPIGPESEALAVSALWDANGGVGDGGFTSVPDPSIGTAARLLTNSKQRPTGHLIWGFDRSVQTGDTFEVAIQAELIDKDPSSPTLDLPMALEVDFYYESDTPQATLTARTERTVIDTRTGSGSPVYAFWETLRVPTSHRHCEPNGPGAQTNLYVHIRPVDSARFDSTWIGPFAFFPRNESDVLKPELHKTRTVVAGSVLRNMLDVMNLAVAEFASSGRPVRGVITDTGKKWAPGRLTADHSEIPWLTDFVPGPDFTTGETCVWNLGDPDNRHNIGYWMPRLNHIRYRDFIHDVAESGGIQASAEATSHIVMMNHETFCSSYPASGYDANTFYSRLGSGTGAAALKRGRQANGAMLKKTGSGPTQFECYNGIMHDLPAKGLENMRIVVNTHVDNVSGTISENSYGAMYGCTFKRFGGFYSGITTRDPDTNPGILYEGLDALNAAHDWVGIMITGNVGAARVVTFWGGTDRAAAEAAGPLGGISLNIASFDRLDDYAATFNTTFASLGLTATDIHGSGPDLDATHQWLGSLDQSAPIAQIRTVGGLDTPFPYEITGLSTFTTVVHADIHANGDAWANTDIRQSISRRDCAWDEYCGAGEIALNTATNSWRLIDVYYVGCTWWNEMGFTNRLGGWTPIGAQQGRMNGNLTGVGLSRFVMANGGGLYTTSEKSKRQAGFGFGYLKAGVLVTGTAGAGIVSNSWEAMSNVTNSKNLIPTPGPAYDDTLTFVDGAGGNFTLTTQGEINALLPDGVNYAGKFGPGGVDLSRIDY